MELNFRTAVIKWFQQYAEEYDLPEVKLAIVHCAGQYDEQDIQGFWQEIIEKEVRLIRIMFLQFVTFFLGFTSQRVGFGNTAGLVAK